MTTATTEPTENLEAAWPLDDVKRAIREALDSGPKRVRRRIWIEGRIVEHDGPSPLLEYDSSAVDVIADDGEYQIVRMVSIEHLFSECITAHIRHGWTLKSRTATEARLWRDA